jgi:hypothetical protein
MIVDMFEFIAFLSLFVHVRVQVAVFEYVPEWLRSL